MFDMRRSEDAEGDRRIMGSGRRAILGFIAMEGLFARLAAAGCWDFRAWNGAANFRTWEKSYR
jgi:hypothetical protein